MFDIFNGKNILITGGTGSFGKMFTEMVLAGSEPKRLIIFSRDEMKQWEMRKRFHQPNIRYFIGDIRDKERLHRAFKGVDIIIHAAAVKIVPSAEYNPFEAVNTNVIGAENIINVAIDNGVEKVLALSTDKAANPINLYGATKLCSEKMFIAANNYSAGTTKFSVVRYGNVLGSRGSVVPFFRECASREKVPITDERMTRFWITLPEGVKFVTQSVIDMEGGELFIPKIKSMKIVDLAEAICPGCEHEIVGIRPGEKLHEVLVPADDGINTYEYADRFITYSEVVDHVRKIDGGKLVGLGFEGYRSDNNTDWLSIDELREMVRDIA